jgi:hypothetical protein
MNRGRRTIMSTPQTTVKDRFKSKDKLVAAVEKLMTDDLWVSRLSNDKGGSKGLKHVSNTKLLNLLDTLTAVKEKFGTRAKLIDAVLEAEGRTKDSDYKGRLGTFAVPQLFDQYKSSALRAKRNGGKPAAPRKRRIKKSKK